MTHPIRYLIVFVITFVLWFSGRFAYRYFGDTCPPEISIAGIEHGGYYSGDIPCVISVRDNAKVAEISLSLDGKLIVPHYKVNAYATDYSLTIPTPTLPGGLHELRIDAVDASYRKHKSSEQLQFYVDNEPLLASFVRSDADLRIFQGNTLHLVFQVNKPIKSALVKVCGRTFSAVPEDADSLVYEAFIPFACEDRPTEYPLTIDITDNIGNLITLDTKVQVVLFPFTQQKLSLKPEDIEIERAAGADEKSLEDQLTAALAKSPAKKLWRGSFYAPIDVKRISTPFGTVRITQHRGKYVHRAVDLVGEPRHVVWASQGGVIIIRDRFAHSGNTIVIDHGCGIFSLYFHLDTFGAYAVGDTVQQGNPIGTIGKTGFANGFHLHFEMRIQNIPINPMQWLQNDF